ncbi:MAG: NDP-sugar synthase [Spirochaetia bacterium]|nr:NDP-sugar synthase [Spirochaetia bacterium]
MKALILIGGEGTRLRPLTVNTLKCMAPIANRPFIEYQFELLKKHGVRDVVLSVCHMPDRVKKAVGNGRRYGIKVSYADEKNPLGTGGAIKNAERFLDSTTIVMNGDILSDINLGEAVDGHERAGASVTIALHRVADPSSYGLVETDSRGRIRDFTEKPDRGYGGKNWINAGIYIFSKEAIASIPPDRNVSVEREIFPGMIKAGEKVRAYKAGYYWLDIGMIQKYMQANFDVAEGRFSGKKGSATGKGCSLKGADIKKPSVIGGRVKVGTGTVIENSVIWDTVKIGKGCVIRNSVLGKGCVIEDNCTVADAALGDGTIMTKYSNTGR